MPTPAQAVIPHEMLITPGQLRGVAHAPGDPWVLGYWEYLPANFDMLGPADTLPLLVFLPGIGEYDDVSSCPGGTDTCVPADCGGDGLCRNLTWGPQQLMVAGQWDDVTRPFIMVSPQNPVPPFSVIEWDLAQLDAYLQFIVDNYPVDQRRMYLIGMSQGGRGTLQYTQAYSRRFTAVAPAPGGVVDLDATCYFQDTGLWIFHGEDDANGNLGPGVFSPCAMVDLAYQYENPDLWVGSPQCQSIVGEPRPPGRLTMFYNVAHSSWRETVDPIGLGFPAAEWATDQGCFIPATFREYSAALDPDGVYSWFLSLDRPGVTAPADFTHDAPDTALAAVIVDDDPVTITWTQTAGPAAVLANADTDTLDVSGMIPAEQYTFQIYVLDSDGQWNLDEVTVTTEEMFGGGSSSGEASTGDAETTGGVATTVGESSGGESTGAPGNTSIADTTAGDDTPGPASSGEGGVATSGTPPVTTMDGGGGTDGTGGGDSSGNPSSDDGGGGCSVHADRSPRGSWWAWAVVLLALRRRRGRP